MKEQRWYYEKLDEDFKVKHCPMNDYDGSITGLKGCAVLGVKQWFDENPEERIRLGWIKHIEHSPKDIEYNKGSQYLVKGIREIDPFTVEDVYNIFDKSEEQMALEELLEGVDMYGDGIVIMGEDWE